MAKKVTSYLSVLFCPLRHQTPGSMTHRSVWHSEAMSIGEAMKVEPITADINADNAAM